jgi:hypothetical protein
VDRESTKHGPAMDDQLAHEAEGMVRGGGTTHAEEWKEPEPTDERTDRAAGKQPAYREPAAPPGMTPRDVAIRSGLARVLASAEFPATRGSLLQYLDEIVASGPVVNAIAALPPDQEFANSGEVVAALGVPKESHRF